MMKALFKIIFIFLIPVSVSTQYPSSIGGGYEASLLEEFSDPKEKEIDYNYSEIPANDIYETWDTKNIHAYSFNRWSLKDTLSLIMRYDSCDFNLPHEGHITSSFGKRSGGYHHGIDIKLAKGEDVKSAFEGMVRISQYSSSYGHVIVVRHNNGIETLYAHLSKRLVKPGDHVEAGDILGLGGNTGRSSGSHLHFECRYKGEPINPSKIVDFKEGKLKDDTIFLTKGNFKSSKNFLKKKKPVAKKTTTNKTESTSQKSSVKKDLVKTVVNKTSSNKTSSELTNGKVYYRVKSGNTIYSLARDNGVSVEQIRAWNNIGKNNVIKVGSKIRVQ